MQTDHTEVMAWLKKTATAVSTPRKKRISATLSPTQFRESLQQLIDHGFHRLITITGNDIEKQIELIYHFVRGDTVLSIKTLVAKKTSTHPTISDLLPAATFYEQEVHELFGITFQGHPDLTHLLLPDDWPPHIYPLRKKWSLSALVTKLKEPP